MRALSLALVLTVALVMATLAPGCAKCEKTTTQCVLWGCGASYTSSGKCYSPVCIDSAPVTEVYYSGSCHDGDREITE